MIDAWFLDQMLQIVEQRALLSLSKPDELTPRQWRRAKQMGFSDGQLAHLWDSDELIVRDLREGAGVIPTYKTVDTCAAEFAAETPYHYSTYEDENEVQAIGSPACGHPG